ncbi:MAG: hypothetical protein HQM11_08310 [SAR324 cluster bacterium]|nr:hypothetical protein [SAR324 cluster bacterium]
MKVTTKATDLVHAFCQFAFNWTYEDINAMFQHSPLGAQYWETRFQEVNSSLTNLYMVADTEHRLMIISFIVNYKYPEIFKKNEPVAVKSRPVPKLRKKRKLPLNSTLKLVIDNTRSLNQQQA